MSTPVAVAQHALDAAQTQALIGEEFRALEILLSALHHIASGGKWESKRWAGLRKDWDRFEAESRPA